MKSLFEYWEERNLKMESHADLFFRHVCVCVWNIEHFMFNTKGWKKGFAESKKEKNLGKRRTFFCQWEIFWNSFCNEVKLRRFSFFSYKRSRTKFCMDMIFERKSLFLSCCIGSNKLQIPKFVFRLLPDVRLVFSLRSYNFIFPSSSLPHTHKTSLPSPDR